LIPSHYREQLFNQWRESIILHNVTGGTFRLYKAVPLQLYPMNNASRDRNIEKTKSGNKGVHYLAQPIGTRYRAITGAD